MTEIEYWLACGFTVCVIINILFLADLLVRMNGKARRKGYCKHTAYVVGYCKECNAFCYKERVHL